MALQSLVVYLADDHALVAAGIKGLLLNDQRIGEVRLFGDGESLFKACLNIKPDIIFLDFEMPVWNGLKTLQKLRENGFTIPCVLLSMLEEKAIIESCLAQGANGFIHKDCTVKTLGEVITAALKGEIFLSAEAQNILNSSKRSFNTKSIEIEPISDREMDVLNLMCDGLSSQEISDKLFLSRRTVETHKNNLMKKFNVNSTIKVVSMALKNRIIT